MLGPSLGAGRGRPGGLGGACYRHADSGRRRRFCPCLLGGAGWFQRVTNTYIYNAIWYVMLCYAKPPYIQTTPAHNPHVIKTNKRT